MSQQRHTVLTQHLQELAAAYVNTQSNKTSLITITNTELTHSLDKITFYVSVFPETAEGPALGFLMRKRGECKKYLKEKSKMNHIPHVEFMIDEGEKSRRRVDELLAE
ncbi:MAG: Ribosome-binding factor A [Parcubacteria group bacterium GW2011_GWA2_43_11]|nr:MAG: Ribosome-binding factor A [Parcubacteria group bacterium GW2011_GWC2_42_11]KKS85738.1 MAG: Ribosome-binding factor A [Parcubacteria group bacterium GW2011_GWA2_43_11]